MESERRRSDVWRAFLSPIGLIEVDDEQYWSAAHSDA
jgi:hypothetical protein